MLFSTWYRATLNLPAVIGLINESYIDAEFVNYADGFYTDDFLARVC